MIYRVVSGKTVTMMIIMKFNIQPVSQEAVKEKGLRRTVPFFSEKAKKG